MKLLILLGVLTMNVHAKGLELATFGAGCFWGVEHIFAKIDGIKDAVSGYSAGNVENPSYAQICTGSTGHAEVVQLSYDPKKIDYEQILDLYFRMHDPTQVNGQGPDIGTQYRSIILTHNKEQDNKARAFLEKLTVGKFFDKPIATKIESFKIFYKAEKYHQDYYANNGKEPYCHALRPSFKITKKKGLSFF